MKALAGLVGAVLGLVFVACLWLLARPYLMPARETPTPSRQASGSVALPPSTAPQPEAPVTPPSTDEERLREELFRQRVPYFRFLHDNTDGIVERFSVPEDHRTLDIVLVRFDEMTLRSFVDRAVAPSASRYGFRRIRFFAHAPPGSTDPLILVAETTSDGAGRWNTFFK